MRAAACYLLLIICLPATAQIYRYTDAQGNPAYSDQPPSNSRSQAIAPTTSNAIPGPTRLSLQPPPPGAKPRTVVAQPYQVLQLSGLPRDGALRANNGSFSVQVLLQPNLQEPHRLRLLLDDQPYGQPGTALELRLENIDRGEHRLAVQVLNGEHVVQQSPSTTFHLLRVHRP
jgi:hypothetical protein